MCVQLILVCVSFPTGVDVPLAVLCDGCHSDCGISASPVVSGGKVELICNVILLAQGILNVKNNKHLC